MNKTFLVTLICTCFLLATKARAEKCSDFSRNLIGDEAAERLCDPDPGYKARMEKLDRVAAPESQKPSSVWQPPLEPSREGKVSTPTFEFRADITCLKFEQIQRNEVAPFLKEMEQESPYTVDDYFQRSGCQAKLYTRDTKSPMLHVVIDAPATREGFPEVVYKYYTIRRKDVSLWLKAVNAKNTVGETFLDYVETRIRSGKISSPETMESAINIRNFVCSKGAVYSRYIDKKCPL